MVKTQHLDFTKIGNLNSFFFFFFYRYMGNIKSLGHWLVVPGLLPYSSWSKVSPVVKDCEFGSVFMIVDNQEM